MHRPVVGQGELALQVAQVLLRLLAVVPARVWWRTVEGRSEVGRVGQLQTGQQELALQVAQVLLRLLAVVPTFIW